MTRGIGLRAWSAALLLACMGLALAADHPASAEAMYRRGVMPNGQPLVGQRVAGGSLQGAAAACVNCHQRSGFGGREGRVTVPPITGRYLFSPSVATAASAPGSRDRPYLEGLRSDRPPYTEATLARAVREGVDASGRKLADLMPRYSIGDREMDLLIAYLRGLDAAKSPGVTTSHLHFATIVTPDADPAKKRAMLAVMRQFVEDHNVRQMATVSPLQTSAKTAYARSMFMVHRKWELHVWELAGDPASWGAQLDRRLAEEPVFAVLSGLGGLEWGPVHDFCERSALPCLFPNVEAPPAQADRDFYSMYYSRGVLLEADLAAHSLTGNPPKTGPRQVVQVLREGDVGEAAAKALTEALVAQPVRVSQRVVPRSAPPSAVASAVADAAAAAGPADALVLWLRADDVAALASVTPPPATVYLSGQMVDLEHAPLAPAWRPVVRLLYPYDLPDKRRARVSYAMGWMHAKHIPVTMQRVQVDTYLVMGLVAETLQHMTDAFVRDYLVERFQSTLDHRIVTGFYPRLSLAPGQRFASKGGLIVRFGSLQGGLAVQADTDWTVP